MSKTREIKKNNEDLASGILNNYGFILQFKH